METLTEDGRDVILENDRDRRTFAYLIKTCGYNRVAQARLSLRGRTRPYVSNIAKVLGVAIPEAVVITPREEGRNQLAQIKQMLISKLREFDRSA